MSSASAVLPLIVLETLVSPFKFWNEGIHRGMLYRNDFYKHFHQFAATERIAAYAKATEVSNSGYTVCITVSQTHYTIWVEMRSHLNPSGNTKTSTDSAERDLPTLRKTFAERRAAS